MFYIITCHFVSYRTAEYYSVHLLGYKCVHLLLSYLMFYLKIKIIGKVVGVYIVDFL